MKSVFLFLYVFLSHRTNINCHTFLTVLKSKMVKAMYKIYRVFHPVGFRIKITTGFITFFNVRSEVFFGSPPKLGKALRQPAAAGSGTTWWFWARLVVLKRSQSDQRSFFFVFLVPFFLFSSLVFCFSSIYRRPPLTVWGLRSFRVVCPMVIDEIDPAAFNSTSPPFWSSPLFFICFFFFFFLF